MRRVLVAVVLVLLAGPSPSSADIVSDWVDLAGRAPDGRALPPPLQDRVQRTAPSVVALTLFETANRLDHRYRSYLALQPVTGDVSADAALSAGAHAVLVALRPAQKERLDEALMLALAHVPAGPAREAGLALGRETAAIALARPLFDGPAYESYRPPGPVGRFAPPMPSVMEPWALRAQPWLLASLDEVMPPPPPPLTGARYARDFDEVKTAGRAMPPPRSAALVKADFIGGFSLEPMLHRIADAKPRQVDRARFWALVRMAQHDANAMTAFAKMRYLTWRPWNAIRNADRDDNPLTERDAEWTPALPTPNHPEYPCGHCVASGLIAGLLSGEPAVPITVASETMPGQPQLHFDDWPAFLAATSQARIDGGMHFRFANEAGQAMGARIAAIARARFAPEEPSP